MEKNNAFSFPTFEELYESVGKGLKKDTVKLDKDFWRPNALEIIIMAELFDNKKSKSFKFNLKDADGKKINIHKYYWLNDKKS